MPTMKQWKTLQRENKLPKREKSENFRNESEQTIEKQNNLWVGQTNTELKTGKTEWIYGE